MTRVFIWKNNSPQEWEEISFSAFSKARRNGCFTGRFFLRQPKMLMVTTKELLPSAHKLVIKHIAKN